MERKRKDETLAVFRRFIVRQATAAYMKADWKDEKTRIREDCFIFN